MSDVLEGWLCLATSSDGYLQPGWRNQHLRCSHQSAPLSQIQEGLMSGTCWLAVSILGMACRQKREHLGTSDLACGAHAVLTFLLNLRRKEGRDAVRLHKKGEISDNYLLCATASE